MAIESLSPEVLWVSEKAAKKRKSLKVSVSYEPSRLADECLAAAYEQVVPVRSRLISTKEARVEIDVAPEVQADVVGLESLADENSDSVNASNQS